MKMNYSNDKIPPRCGAMGKRRAKLTQLLYSLNPGDYFDYPEKERLQVYKYARRHGIRVIGRQLEDGEKVRFWVISEEEYQELNNNT
jgi:hypothetical protein